MYDASVEDEEQIDMLCFNLPPCLCVPIAAKSREAIEEGVGCVSQAKTSRTGRIDALLVHPHQHPITRTVGVKLWSQPDADLIQARLHPNAQVWVHVDYTAYRRAYQFFGMPPLPNGYFLDHVQNREAVRLRGHSHPYLRLCPVSHKVNTSGGSVHGGEGIEKDVVRDLATFPAWFQKLFYEAMQHPLRYADPMDLTKMLDVPPGTKTLPGVRDIHGLFYV